MNTFYNFRFRSHDRTGRLETCEVIKETDKFITVRHPTVEGFVDRREKKRTDYWRWFPTAKEALDDAEARNMNSLTVEFAEHTRKVKQMGVVREQIEKLRRRQ